MRIRTLVATAAVILILGLATVIHAQPAPGAPARAPAPLRPIWDWSGSGALNFGTTYRGTLPITNSCKAGVTVAATSDVPGLTHDRTVTVGPGQTYAMPFTLTTPPRPALPTRPADAANPAHRHCLLVHGTVALARAGTPRPDEDCERASSTIEVVGHVHWTYVAPPEQTPRSDDCTTHWNRGTRPPADRQFDARCTGAIRDHGAALRERVLDALARLDPPSWAWLPSVDRIRAMSIDDVLAMKARAVKVVGVKR